MSVGVSPFVANDFSGGFTDNFVNAPLNQAEKVENFLIKENKSIITRPGSHVEDPTNAPGIPVGNQRIGLAINYDDNDKLFVQSANRIYYRDPLTYSTLSGPSGNDVFPTASVTSKMAYSEWRKQVFMTSDTFETPKKFYRDDAGLYQLRTAGMPALASAPTITPSVAGSSTFLYKFVYTYVYKAGQQEYKDAGPVTTVEVTNSDDPSTNQNDISLIPVLANGATESYDTAVVKVEIFRTIDGGTTAYKIGEVTNGTTVFVDNFADSAIQSNEVIYTEGGVLDNDSPPLAKYVHIVNNTAIYANLKEGTEFLPSDILQSVPEDPDSVPAANRVIVDDDIRGVHSVQSIPMIFCRKHIYRIEGFYNEVGQGAPIAIIINDTAGCVSHNSIVQAKDFVFWAGNDKFYASDGYKVIPISDHFNERYKQMLSNSVDAENIVGAYDEKNERIYWAIQRDSGSLDNDTIWVLDLRWGLSQNSSFTELTGGDSFAPTGITFLNDELVRADKRGYVFIHSESDQTDPKVDTSLLPTAWVNQAIEHEYLGFATNFGTDAFRKWVTRTYITAVNVTNVSIGLFAINDDGKSTREITPIRYRRNFIWGDPEFVWGDADFVWNAAGLIQEMRRMPRGGLRCSYFQMQIKNAFSAITNSDTIGTATIASPLATLDTAADSDWPSDAVDYFIAFESDNYTREYLITARTDDTITFLDTGGTAPSGSQKWVIRGVRKSEVLNLLSYTLQYAPISQSQSMFEAGGAGENA